jgi:hypothetical protein
MIPDSYVTVENRILCQYPNIRKKLGKNGDLEMIKRLFKIKMVDLWSVALGAAEAGNIFILEWLVEKGYSIVEKTTAYAAKGNQLKTLKWLMEECKLPIHSSAVKYAAKRNHMDMLKFLVVENSCSTIYGGYFAALNGYLDTIKFLFRYVSHGFQEQFLFDVRNGGITGSHLEIVKFAFGQGYPLVGNYVFCEDVDILRWLVENKHLEADDDLVFIATTDNLECFKYAYKLVGKISYNVQKKAMEYHHEAIIQFLLNEKYDLSIELSINASFGSNNKAFSILKLFKVSDWPRSVFKHAAQGGNIDILQCGYDHGYHHDFDIITNAAKNGQLHVIIWAREHNFKWDTEATASTIDDGHIDILKWLRNIDGYRSNCKLISNETELCPWNERVCLQAIKNHNLPILKLAIENGCDYGNATKCAAILSKCNKIKEYMCNKK